MLCVPKSISRFIFQLSSTIQQLHRGYSRRCYPKIGNDKDMGNNGENKQEHLYMYKSKGQHLLTNPRILDSIVRKSAIKPTDTVLEIGPGTGNLTLKLLEVAAKVIAIEIDSRMVEVLQKRVFECGLHDRLTVIRQDALKMEFPPFDLVVANIPYLISSPLVAKLVFRTNPFRSATLLLQKEFARRLLANPGDSEFNRLAVNVKLVANVEFVMDVSKRNFLPCPKVDSSVVMIRPKAEVPNVNLEEWQAFTRVCFSKKNKTLGATFKQKRKVMELFQLTKIESTVSDNSHEWINYEEDEEDGENDEEELSLSSCSVLETGVGSFRERLIEVLRSGGFEEKRPSKLPHEELLRLLRLFNQAGIYFRDLSKSRDAVDEVFAFS